MTAETPATELTEAELDAIRDEFCDCEGHGLRDDQHAPLPDGCHGLQVKAAIAARAKPAPSGDERDALTALLGDHVLFAEDHDGRVACVCSKFEFRFANRAEFRAHVADVVLADGFRRAVSPAPSGAEAALAEVERQIEVARNDHWQEHLRLHPLANARSCPRDYGIHDALAKASSIVRDARRALSPSAGPDEGTKSGHGQIKTVDRKGYSLYVCEDCGQNINNPVCTARTSTQPSPPTFDSLLHDPTQQLDSDGEVARSAFLSAGPDEAVSND